MENKVIVNGLETSFTLLELNEIFAGLNKKACKIGEEIDGISEDKEKEDLFEELLENM